MHRGAPMAAMGNHVAIAVMAMATTGTVHGAKLIDCAKAVHPQCNLLESPTKGGIINPAMPGGVAIVGAVQLKHVLTAGSVAIVHSDVGVARVVRSTVRLKSMGGSAARAARRGAEVLAAAKPGRTGGRIGVAANGRETAVRVGSGPVGN